MLIDEILPRVAQVLVTSLSLLASFQNSSSLNDGAVCKTLTKRQEWRTLTKTQKASYIDAVKCLQKLPAIGPVKAAKTRFDDFQAVHIALTDEVHNVGQFLPWHRRMLNVHEKALREECGYKGPYTYWDWTLDVGKTGTFVGSPVFDPIDGFGGNGANASGVYTGQFSNLTHIPTFAPGTGGGCVLDGPFASYNLSLGPGTLATNHCLQRGFNDNFAHLLTVKQLNTTLKLGNFEEFRTVLEGIPAIPGAFGLHAGAHFGVGGEMNDVYSSPGDPLFYLHHANLDRIWWIWQTASSSRLYDITGVSSVDPPFANVTLDFGLKMNGLAAEIPIRDVMDIRNGLLCYTYV